ncbi:MAG: DUF4982 domain-containing protein [Bacteroides cellulosilyticus]|nr:DUF4982 domain-containing protein [Bacteroides cellulosilyticus]
MYSNRRIVRVCALSIFLLLTCSVSAQRIVRSLDDGWRFRIGAHPEAAAVDCDDRDWEPVRIPHTWNGDAYTVKEYYRGEGWYRRNLRVSVRAGQRYYIRMDAAGKTAQLYVNGKDAGSHRGGYTAAVYDVTDLLRPAGDNVLAVRVDNADDDVPPLSGDFTFFGGIYRDVWLVTVPECHFTMTDKGSPGLYVSTPEASAERGTVALRGFVANDAAERCRATVEVRIFDPAGRLVDEGSCPLRLAAGEQTGFSYCSRVLKNPALWTPEAPNRYRVEATLRRNRQESDRMTLHTAFRWFRFDAEEGFFLNGEPYKLRGVCRHQDQKPYGVALTDEMHRRDFALIKEMGANFVRLAHYPQDDAFLEECDRQGMLVWEEIPVIDIVPDLPAYADAAEENLREMIRQHYNRPSVILWGYMNEILLVAQRRYRTQSELQPVLTRTRMLAERLENVVKQEDTTRMSVMAFHGSNDYNRCGLSEITDVVGWNLYNGWYGGDLEGFDRFAAQQHRDYPDHPIIVSEYGAGSDRRLHSLVPRPFDFSIEYQQRYLEHYLPVLEINSYLCGGALWNLIDFSSAKRDESMPRINNKGVVYADRTPKDVYYYYRAVWRTDLPVLRIASRDWLRRTWTVDADGQAMLPVKIYTNLPEVELFVDGRSLGRRQPENRIVIYDVPFRAGGVSLRAVGTSVEDRPVEDALYIDFSGVPERTAEAEGALEIAVNVGSDCCFTSDRSGTAWLPDRPYTEGGWGCLGGEADATQAEIACTEDGPLFQTLRRGLDGYRFDLPNGTYEVELLFADPYRQAESSVYLLGRDAEQTAAQNRFRVEINDRTVEEAYAPEGLRAAVRRYTVENRDGHVEIRFRALAGSTLLNALRIRRCY